MSYVRARLALTGVCIGALLALAGTAGGAFPNGPSPNLVISQIYGGGGNSGATYTHDYIEIFNRSSASVSLDGKSLQYTSAAGTGNFGANSGLLTELSGSLAPGQYLLVREASNAAVGASADALSRRPDPDQHVRHGGEGRARQRHDHPRVQHRRDLRRERKRHPDHRPHRLRSDGDLLRRRCAGPDSVEHVRRVPQRRRLSGQRFERLRFHGRHTEPAYLGLTAPLLLDRPIAVRGRDHSPNGATEVPTDSNVTVTFSEQVTAAPGAFALACTTSGAVALTVTPGAPRRPTSSTPRAISSATRRAP